VCDGDEKGSDDDDDDVITDSYMKKIFEIVRDEAK
jgi:hypothetical protein